MKRYAVALAAFASVAAHAQFSEVGSMTVMHSHIDFDALAAGPTTLAAINAAGTNGGANIASIVMPDKTTAASGVYNTNGGYGNALGRLNGVMSIIPPPTGAFDAVTYDIGLGMASTQFGLSVGDWNGPAVLEFFSGGGSLGTFTTSSFSSSLPQIFIESTSSFDRVTIDVSTTGGNFVIPDLWVQTPVPEPATMLALGAGIAALAARRRRK